MKKSVIIVAGGAGKRMKSTTAKQFLILKNKPLLMHTIKVFYDYDNSIKIILALPENHINYWNNLCQEYNFNVKHQIVTGGKTRFHSVKNGIKAIKNGNLIAIHDGVRPLVSLSTISRCFEMAYKKGNAIPIIDIPETIREVGDNYNKLADRTKYKLSQTPQIFEIELIKKAYKQDFKAHFTDDASLLDEIGIALNLVEGNRENIKITTHTDLKIAEALMN